MNTFALINNFFIEDHYPSDSVVFFKSELSKEEIIRRINEHLAIFLENQLKCDEIEKASWDARRAVESSNLYQKNQLELQNLTKFRNTRCNSVPKKDRNDNWKREIDAVLARIETLQNENDGMLLSIPVVSSENVHKTLVIGDLEIQFNVKRSYDDDTWEILTLEEFVSKNESNKISIN